MKYLNFYLSCLSNANWTEKTTKAKLNSSTYATVDERGIDGLLLLLIFILKRYTRNTNKAICFVSFLLLVSLLRLHRCAPQMHTNDKYIEKQVSQTLFVCRRARASAIKIHNRQSKLVFCRFFNLVQLTQMHFAQNRRFVDVQLKTKIFLCSQKPLVHKK